jgi:hypothetical protein
MAPEVEVGAGDNGADRHCTSPAGEEHTAAPNQNLLSEKGGLESKSRAFEPIIQRLTTDQAHATPAPNTSQLPLGTFGICGSSELTSGLFGIHGLAEPTPGQSGSYDFSVKASNLPMYEGK